MNPPPIDPNPNPRKPQSTRQLWGQFLVFTGPLVATAALLGAMRTQGTRHYTAGLFLSLVGIGIAAMLVGYWLWCRKPPPR